MACVVSYPRTCSLIIMQQLLRNERRCNCNRMYEAHDGARLVAVSWVAPTLDATATPSGLKVTGTGPWVAL